jgi:hypothetical protein
VTKSCNARRKIWIRLHRLDCLVEAKKINFLNGIDGKTEHRLTFSNTTIGHNFSIFFVRGSAVAS